MAMRSLRRTMMFAALLTLAQVSSLYAQPLGTFRWQLQPFCNVLALSVTQVGAIYRLEGIDELCAAGTGASVIGTASLKPDGTVAMGLTVVLDPGAESVHISAVISLSTLNGTWHDDGGNSGNFVFNPTIAAGNPRPPIDRSTSGWVIVNSDASLRGRSDNMEGVSVQKPPGTNGIYCFRFPSEAGFQSGGAQGSIIQAFSGNGIVGFITVTSTINSACSILGPWNVTVQTYNAAGTLENRYFRLFVPR